MWGLTPSLTTRPRRFPRWLRRLAIVAIVVSGLYAFRAQLLPLPARFLDVSVTPEVVDYALVLNGDAQTRPFVAAALFRCGLARKVLVTEAILTPGEEDGVVSLEHEVVKRVLQARGVPEEAVVFLPGQIASTFDEAHALADFLDGNPGSSVAVVTNPFHTRRARWVFRRVLGDRASRLCFVGAPRDGVSDADWWRTENGMATYFSEYVKFGYYMLRY
jgi:uncharacterized SAM-binding protein YcdF (DUF218 family)